MWHHTSNTINRTEYIHGGGVFSVIKSFKVSGPSSDFSLVQISDLVGKCSCIPDIAPRQNPECWKGMLASTPLGSGRRILMVHFFRKWSEYLSTPAVWGWHLQGVSCLYWPSAEVGGDLELDTHWKLAQLSASPTGHRSSSRKPALPSGQVPCGKEPDVALKKSMETGRSLPASFLIISVSYHPHPHSVSVRSPSGGWWAGLLVAAIFSSPSGLDLQVLGGRFGSAL